MKFLSLRTVYRVIPIIKHSKTFGPRLIPTLGPIDLEKIFSLFVSSRTINMPNFIEIGWEIREKLRDASELERKIRKYNKKKKKQNKNRKVFRRCRQTFNNKKKKKQNKNRKVFRRCRQTFNKRKLAGKFKLQLSTNVAERGGGLGSHPIFFLQLLQVKRRLRVEMCEYFIS